MEQKIQELTDKIYREGVEKGEKQAEKIVSDAKEEADRILSDARNEAGKIIADAKEQAKELKRNMESEIRLSGSQAVASVKQQILDLVTAKVVGESTTKALTDPEAMKEYITQVISNWKIAEGQAPHLEILLPEVRRTELENALISGISNSLKSGIDFKFSKSLKAGFQIGPAEGAFKISLTDEDFNEFFKEYLRPKTRVFLFGE
jgi:V/A-type H+/Na+-transporting ATPase subunit E